MKKRLIFILGLAGIMLAGCSVYKLDVQQGNVIDPKQLALLKLGMDKQKVEFIMGTPLLADPFHPQRWDYVYLNTPGNGKTVEKRVTLYFEGNELARIDEHLDSAQLPKGGTAPK